jgi:phage host-nuclease inhibitor protein Gam
MLERQPHWLGREFQIDGVETAELALQELAAVVQESQAVNADVERQMRETIEDGKRRSACDLGDGGELLTLVERAKQIEEAVIVWADKNRAALCKGDAKHAELRNGKLTWRFKPAACTFLEGTDEAAAIDKLWKAKGFRKMVDALVEKAFAAFGSVVLKLKIDRTAAKKSYEAGAIGKQKLKALGLQYVERCEYVALELVTLNREGIAETDAEEAA